MAEQTTQMNDITYLERANYRALLPVTEVTPGLELVIRDEVILTSSQAFPEPDSTHACSIRATPETVDTVLDDITTYFKAKDLNPTVFLSPGCTPSNLPDRLEKRGFTQQATQEVWLVLNRLKDFSFRYAVDDSNIVTVDSSNSEQFSETFLRAFELPTEFAPYLTQLLTPSVGLSEVFHYMVKADGENIGTISLTIYNDIGIVGSAGVIPAYRKSKYIVNLFNAVYDQAERSELKTLMCQSENGSAAAQLLQANNFRPAFTRHCYVLE